VSDPAEAEPARRRDRSTKARHAERQKKFERERRIVNYLNAGVAVAEIAEREGVTHRRMRAVVQEILARRMPAPPAEFLAMQVGRLNEALLISYSAMSGDNLRAVDRYVRIVRELDRYHGFAAPRPPARPAPPCLKAPAKASLLLEALDANQVEGEDTND
jgi:hypothetical protein